MAAIWTPNISLNIPGDPWCTLSLAFWWFPPRWTHKVHFRYTRTHIRARHFLWRAILLRESKLLTAQSLTTVRFARCSLLTVFPRYFTATNARHIRQSKHSNANSFLTNRKQRINTDRLFVFDLSRRALFSNLLWRSGNDCDSRDCNWTNFTPHFRFDSTINSRDLYLILPKIIRAS